MSIVSFTPASQWAGSTITITGAHFNAETTANIVTLNGTVATVKSATSDKLTVIVPAEGNGTGLVEVTIRGQVATASSNFTYEAWQSVSAGERHTCGLSSAGAIWCWGDNFLGQLGNGTNTSANTPQRMGTASDWISLETGPLHTCGLRVNGTAWCWGWNNAGELGNGTITTATTPQQVRSASDWISLAVGGAHTCGLRANGTAWCWGRDLEGQLGDDNNGVANIVTTPLQVGTASDWISLTAGGVHTCGLRVDGTWWCWGDNSNGQFGNGANTSADTPQQVGTASDWISLEAGSGYTCGLRVDGTAWCWGNNNQGKLGNGDDTYTPTNTPQQVGTASDWISLEVGGSHTCGLRIDGTAWCWGFNFHGGLGNGAYDLTISANTPQQVGTASDWISLEVGDYHTCGLRIGGTVWCWGENFYGQLGNGATSDSTMPVLITNPANP
jgi:alpha-tubulin suppressor-like RCC1 family protein